MHMHDDSKVQQYNKTMQNEGGVRKPMQRLQITTGKIWRVG